jgi:GR25 family glycosyltransferase involved in LPS biosynthesis
MWVMLLLLIWLTITLLVTAAEVAREQCTAAQEKAAAPHILFINLDRSPERRMHTEAWLAADPYITNSTIIIAIDASLFSRTDVEEELSTYATLHTSNNSSTKATMQARIWSFDFGGRMPALGCGLSHAKAILVAYATGLEEVLIVEDDVEAIKLVDSSDNSSKVWNYLRQLLDSLPSDWDILQLSKVIYVPYKVIEMHDLLMHQVLWSRRNECSGDSFLLLGTGAYIISRKGMHAFLSKHLPQFLTATLQEAVAFNGLIDLRSSVLAIISDLWIYDLDNVFVSHLPLFIPADYVASETTVQSGVSGMNSTLSTYQLEALQ